MIRIAAVILTAVLLAACASNEPYGAPPPRSTVGTFTDSEVVSAVEDWLGVSAETAGTIVERVFSDLGTPQGYIYGEEASGAVGVGLRYGQGVMVLEDNRQRTVYWQGPSVGFDAGGNASKTFTLVYNIQDPDNIYQRFPGVEGTAYLVGGVGVNYQRANGITLVPMRAGVGARLGANVGYLAYSRGRNILPF